MISLRTIINSMFYGVAIQCRRGEDDRIEVRPAVSAAGLGWPWPSDLVPLVVIGIALGAQVLIVVAVLLKPTWVDPPMSATVFPFDLKIVHGDERDQTLYHLGLVLITTFGMGFVWLNRFLGDGTGRRSRSAVRSTLVIASRVVVLGGLLAQGVLPSLLPATAHAFIGLVPAVGFLVLSVAATVVAFASTRVLRDSFHQAPAIQLSDGSISDGRTDIQLSRSPSRRYLALAIHGFTAALIIAALYIPDLSGFLGYNQGLDHGFFHWNFFVMAPGHAFLLGLTPVLDSYSQYGVGIPIVLADIARLLGGFTYVNVIGLGIFLAIPYYLGVYGLFWIWTRSHLWSVFGVVTAILVQVYRGRDLTTTIWDYPSSTYLRAPLDVSFFLVMTWHQRARRPILLIILGAIVGCSLFWELDTGIYLAASYFAYCGYTGIASIRQGRRMQRTVPGYLGAIVLAPVIFLVLLVMTIGNAAFTTLFWTHLLEPIQLFNSGFGMLPMPDPAPHTLYLFLTPAVYGLAIVLGLAAAVGWTREPWPFGSVLGAVGVYGIGYYQQYVGRSHPFNWDHVSMPLVLIAITFGYLIQADLVSARRKFTLLSLRVASRVALVVIVGWVGVSAWFQIAGAAPRPGVTYEQWSLPGTGFRSASFDGLHVAETQVIVDQIDQLIAPGERVAILSEFDAQYYLMADRRPFSRFVPLYTATATFKQAAEVRGDLLAPDLRYVLLERHFVPGDVGYGEPRDLPEILFSDVAQNFKRVGTIGFFEVWLRGSPP